MSLAEAKVFETDEPRPSFDSLVKNAIGKPLHGRSLDTVQVNIGLSCNLACRHCHVESSPKRTEMMSWDTMMAVLRAAENAGSRTLDITGGAPEMHPHFRAFVDAATGRGLHVMVRTNLTILAQPSYEELPAFFAERGVHLIASLPCYLEVNVDKQRGRHVYRDSIAILQRLNRLGYGRDGGYVLDLVYNPGGASLPPAQSELEKDYRRTLLDQFGIHFNSLYVITNMAIGRFLSDLERTGKTAAYQQLLSDAFNAATLEDLMCCHQLHVGWDGTMYDCDFNLALNLPALGELKIQDFTPERYRQRRIVTGEHCFACTAGCGSSCGGALV